MGGGGVWNGRLQRAERKLLEMMHVFIILNLVMASLIKLHDFICSLYYVLIISQQDLCNRQIIPSILSDTELCAVIRQLSVNMNTQMRQKKNAISDMRTERTYQQENSKGQVSDKMIIISEENFEMQ